VRGKIEYTNKVRNLNMAMPNPFANYPMSDDWAAHRARGSLGGVDFATPVGTPIYAPVSGSVRFEAGSGSGGYIISLALADSPGYVMQFLHCSGFNESLDSCNLPPQVLLCLLQVLQLCSFIWRTENVLEDVAS